MEEFAKYVISDISGSVGELITQFSENYVEVALDVGNAGGGILDLCSDISENIGVIDVRFLGEYGNIFEDFASFQGLVSAYAQDDRTKKVLELYEKRISKLEKLLREDWNTKLSKTIEAKSFIFKKISPLKDETKIPCNLCRKQLKNKRCLESHFKCYHPDDQVPNVPDDTKLTCLLQTKDTKEVCNKKFDTNQFYRHCESQHGWQRPVKTYIRGFDSVDGLPTNSKEKTWRPVFLPANTPDPTGPSEARSTDSSSDTTNSSPDVVIKKERSKTAANVILSSSSGSSFSEETRSISPENSKLLNESKFETESSGSSFSFHEDKSLSPEKSKIKIESNSDSKSSSTSFEDSKILSPEKSKSENAGKGRKRKLRFVSDLTDSGEDELNNNMEEELERMEVDDERSKNFTPPYEKEIEEFDKEYNAAVFPDFPLDDLIANDAVNVSEDAAFDAAKSLEDIDINVYDEILIENKLRVATVDDKKVQMIVTLFEAADTDGEESEEETQLKQNEKVKRRIGTKGKGKGKMKESGKGKNKGKESKEEPSDGDDDEAFDDIEEYEKGGKGNRRGKGKGKRSTKGKGKEINKEANERFDVEDSFDYFDEDVGDDRDSDSDLDENDDPNFARLKVQNRKLRYEKRSILEESRRLCDMKENSDVIDQFKSFVLGRHFKTTNKKSTTLTSAIGNLFTKTDSYLSFETQKNSNFNLAMNLDPHSSSFQPIVDPGPWLLSIGGDSGQENPDTRLAMLKCWIKWTDFVWTEYQNSQVSAGNDPQYMLVATLAMSNLDALKKRVDRSNIMKQLKELINLKKREKENAEELLDPSKRVKEVNSVPTWFASNNHTQKMEFVTKVWKDVLENKDYKLKPREFVKVANYARFLMCLTSKNRNGCFKFLNRDYVQRVPLWIDGGVDFEDLQIDEDKCKPPASNPEMPPSCFMIKLAGRGSTIKKQEAQTLYINPVTEELLKKYRELKDHLSIQRDFQFDIDDEFFVNFDNQPLGPMTNTPGSLWREFGEVSDLNKGSVNVVRRGSEAHVQSSPQALNRIKDIQNHSASTGKGAYDKLSPVVKSAFMHVLSNKEGSNKHTFEDVPEEVKQKRAKTAEDDRILSLKEAEKALKKDLTKRQVSKTTKVLPEDRLAMQVAFTDPSNAEMFKATDKSKKMFPGLKKFKKLYYRLIDGNCSKNLVEIEERVFVTVVKKEVETEFGAAFDGNNKEMNKSADLKVSSRIRTAFLTYERNRFKNDNKPSYFKFHQ